MEHESDRDTNYSRRAWKGPQGLERTLEELEIGKKRCLSNSGTFTELRTTSFF